MKQVFLLLGLFSSLISFGQKDFDYTIYTNKASYAGLDSLNEGLNLTIFRKVQKDANVIKIISTTNTGDAETFIIRYVGYDIQSKSLLYVVDDNTTIYINPMEATVKVIDEKRRTRVLYY